jgi:mannose-1-phosphate guanylyltransferase
VGDHTLFEEACAAPATAASLPRRDRHRRQASGHVESQLGFAPDAGIVVEPSARNTAAAIARLRCDWTPMRDAGMPQRSPYW